ncbi:hypothetical protein GA0071314_0159 [Halomonas sp. HL-93]|nr:MAG: hypothetical protein HLUCCO06_16070 [Halomonas sp. HL-93]SBR45273.1 hypothetical protein GA0071314_0159 [Halomonas sp. HL-93]SNY97633.1 hypothetical protein SAMN04488142_2238 [Halomonas sp. hl-4]
MTFSTYQCCCVGIDVIDVVVWCTPRTLKEPSPANKFLNINDKKFFVCILFILITAVFANSMYR